jgi:hypothetical protein
MNSFSRALLSATALAAITACSNDATAPQPRSDLSVRSSQSETGNGAPSGYHYTLNIIGMAKQKNVDMNATGSAMFVQLGKAGETAVTTKIQLTESLDGSFAITDKNGTDGVAGFTLPAPTDGEGTQQYAVYARALGTPGGQATITTCAEGYVDSTDAQIADEVCSTENKVFTHDGRPKFENVTQELTTIVIDADLEPGAYLACTGNDTGPDVRVNLFDDCLYNYFWKYDNQGLRILQVRFYPIG